MQRKQLLGDVIKVAEADKQEGLVAEAAPQAEHQEHEEQSKIHDSDYDSDMSDMDDAYSSSAAKGSDSNID